MISPWAAADDRGVTLDQFMELVAVVLIVAAVIFDLLNMELDGMVQALIKTLWIVGIIIALIILYHLYFHQLAGLFFR